MGFSVGSQILRTRGCETVPSRLRRPSTIATSLTFLLIIASFHANCDPYLSLQTGMFQYDTPYT